MFTRFLHISSFLGGAFGLSLNSSTVSSADPPPPPDFVGCYQDAFSNRQLPKSYPTSVIYGSYTTTSKEECRGFARAGGYTYFGLQGGYLCFAGNDVGDGTGAVDVSNCRYQFARGSNALTADGSVLGGMANVNAVYLTNPAKSDFLPTEVNLIKLTFIAPKTLSDVATCMSTYITSSAATHQVQLVDGDATTLTYSIKSRGTNTIATFVEGIKTTTSPVYKRFYFFYF